MKKFYKILLASSLSIVLFISSGVSVLGIPSGGIIDPATKSISQEE